MAIPSALTATHTNRSHTRDLARIFDFRGQDYIKGWRGYYGQPSLNLVA
jgi:hypothetical protein